MATCALWVRKIEGSTPSPPTKDNFAGGYNTMVVYLLSKQTMWVRFPLPAQIEKQSSIY
jgi:hypothetical protein